MAKMKLSNEDQPWTANGKFTQVENWCDNKEKSYIANKRDITVKEGDWLYPVKNIEQRRRNISACCTVKLIIEWWKLAIKSGISEVGGIPNLSRKREQLMRTIKIQTIHTSDLSPDKTKVTSGVMLYNRPETPRGVTCYNLKIGGVYTNDRRGVVGRYMICSPSVVECASL